MYSAGRRAKPPKALALADWTATTAQYIEVLFAEAQAAISDCSTPILRKDGKIVKVKLGGEIAHTIKGVGGHSDGIRVVRCAGICEEAAGLAYMSSGRYDVRPHMLLLFFGQDQRSITPCVRYGTNYLKAWCARYGVGRRWGHALMPAAFDALDILFAGRSTRGSGRVTVASRSSQLHISSRDYTLLRVKAYDTYRLRLREGIERFERVMQGELKRYTPPNRYNGMDKNETPVRDSDFPASRAA